MVLLARWDLVAPRVIVATVASVALRVFVARQATLVDRKSVV